ncbi:MAG: tetratricopeptide (TPR) repeat protein [Halieaceae bacterium]|jgi:tetratricopeptide (TPR) repeat protein
MSKKDPSKTPKPATEANALERSVIQLAQRGKLREAAIAAQQLTGDFPYYAHGWHTASHLALQQKNPKAALQAISKALSLAPGNIQWLVERAQCLTQLDQAAEARSIAVDLCKKPMSTAAQCASLGMLLSQLGLMDLAASQYLRATNLAPLVGANYYNLATVQRALGDLEAAQINLSLAIELDGNDYDAWYARSELSRQTSEQNHIPELETLLGSGIGSPQGKVQILYALAKELEDVGCAEQSFQYLQQGANLRRHHLNYQVQSDTDTMAQIQQHFSAELFDGRHTGSDHRQPVFVLGLPRTGTTLVERILASHSSVHGAGELNDFPRKMMQQVQTLARNQNSAAGQRSREQLLALTTRLDFRLLGDAYLESVRQKIDEAKHFVDKLPLNFLYTGLIHLALPGAKIIHVQREPMDSCYAIYKTLFRDAYPFSYQLQEIGAYYLAYHKLMTHWLELMPGVVHTVRYEDLVADVEHETRRLLAYCELPWEAQCLRFQENTTASTTASAAQVRSALYSSSVGKWRQYSKQLQPLAEQLAAAGVKNIL